MLKSVVVLVAFLMLGVSVLFAETTGDVVSLTPSVVADSKPDGSVKKKWVYTRPKKKSRFDSSLFLKFSKPLHCMYEVEWSFAPYEIVFFSFWPFRSLTIRFGSELFEATNLL